MAISEASRSNGGSDYTPHWGIKLFDFAANVALSLEPVTGSAMKALGLTARFLDRKADEEARRERN